MNEHNESANQFGSYMDYRPSRVISRKYKLLKDAETALNILQWTKLDEKCQETRILRIYKF